MTTLNDNIRHAYKEMLLEQQFDNVTRQLVLDVVNVALTMNTDAWVKLEGSLRGGKSYKKIERQLISKKLEAVNKMLINLSDTIVEEMVAADKEARKQ